MLPGIGNKTIIGAGGVSATGGTITYSGGNTIHTFTSSGTLTVLSGGDAKVLVVAGGGGGANTGSGGGAGGYIYTNNFSLSTGSFSVTVGAGGSGGASTGAPGAKGSNSVFSTLTAEGGGNGVSHGAGAGGNGGSGGGGSIVTSGGTPAGGTGSQGYSGGSGYVEGSWVGGSGGGGGAGQAGTAGGNTAGMGKGGDGLSNSISGSAVTYAGGGGGGEVNGSYAGAGGAGGGGNATVSAAGSNGTNGLGGGGGGGSYTGTYFNGGNGGSGIVIVSYPTAINPVPLSISGLSVWLDASKISLADGTGITSFPDASGNGRHFTGNGTLKTNIINSKNVVRLTSTQVLSNNTNFGRPITIFYVAKQNDTASARLLSGLANNWLMGHHGGMKDAFYAEGWASASSGRAVADTNFHIWIGQQSATTCYMWDGSTSITLATPTAGTQGPNGLVFTGYLGTSEIANCDIAELIVYNSVLSDSDRLKITNYLKWKYNL